MSCWALSLDVCILDLCVPQAEEDVLGGVGGGKYMLVVRDSYNT